MSNMQEQGIQWARMTVLGGLLLALNLAVSGCIFEPRDPAPPSSGEDIPYLSRTSPTNVWENLKISLNFNDTFGWEENIHEDFTYIPDSEAEDQFPGVFAGWNKEKEMNFITNFFGTGSTNVALLRDPDFVVPDPTGDISRWQGVIYYVRVTDPGTQAETRFRGSAIINFQLQANYWYVSSWEDQNGENDPDSGELLPTMGVLRGTFGSN